MALDDLNKVDERFLRNARRSWWAYEIAGRWNLDPRGVKEWDVEEVLEALARIGLEARERKKEEQKRRRTRG